LPAKEVAPLDYLRSEMLRLEHAHNDNSWHRMEEVRDPAQNDTEREWGRHRIFKCTVCEDEIRVQVPESGRRD
jgi:hypothetical protein